MTTVAAKRRLQRAGAPRDYYKRPSVPLTLGLEEFRVRIIRSDHKDILTVDDGILEVSWTEEAGPRKGSFQMAQTPRSALSVTTGHVVALEWRRSSYSEWNEVWRMRITKPEVSITDETTSFTLEEDSTYMNRSKTKWRYGKSKKRPDGWRLDEIIKNGAERMGVKIGKLHPLKHRVKSMKVEGSFMDLVIRCLQVERNDGGGRRMIWRWRNGKLDIVPLARSENMLLIGGALMDAAYSEEMGASFATAITVRGTLKAAKAGQKRKKFKVSVKDKTAIDLYGYVHKELKPPKGIDTVQEARRFARRQLLKRRKVKRTVSFTHPGVPNLRRWDAIKIGLPEVNLSTIAYVNTVSHSVTPGNYTMDVGIRFTDPFVDTRSAKTRLKRCRTLQKRKRKLSPSCVKLLRDARPKPKKKTQRT